MIGQMRHRVVVQAVTVTATGSGGSTEEWGNVGTYWSKVEQVSGTRLLAYNQVYEGNVFKVTMRYHPALDFEVQTHRFLYNGQELVIHTSELIKQRQVWVVFTCSAKGYALGGVTTPELDGEIDLDL